MQSITFECEVITPMFLAGADGSTPELRAPSIKGALRFWWRAMNGHLYNMKTEEAKIFGGTEEGQGRSKVILILKEDKLTTQPSLISLTPHHRKGYCLRLADEELRSIKNTKNCQRWDNRLDACNKAKPPKDGCQVGNFTFILRFDDKAIAQVDIEKLIKVTFLFGGLGKRSRRGFGSCNISINGQKCFETVAAVQEFITSLNLPIVSRIDYPYLKNVEVGKLYSSYESILEDIGLQTHNFNSRNDYHLGFAKSIRNDVKNDQKRMASPVYVSVFKENDSKNYYGNL
jgi:CRISPR-associated protein Cmr1